MSTERDIAKIMIQLKDVFKEELKAEMETLRPTPEKKIGTETREMRVEPGELKKGTDFIKEVLEEMKANTVAVMRKNVELTPGKQRLQFR